MLKKTKISPKICGDDNIHQSYKFGKKSAKIEMQGSQSLVLPKKSLISSLSAKDEIVATSAGEKTYTVMYYLKSAIAGGICCSITHGSLCPVDVVKTRIQLDPVKYNRGLFGGFSQVVAEEGFAGLATGLGPTVVGYFIQGCKISIF